MSGKNSIQVGIKIRPLLRKEKDQQSAWRVVENSIQLADSQTEPYYFDHIFDQDATNQNIFDKMAKQIVHSAIQGFNGTIFAYGQTSSGKTYTMMGDDHNPGVMVLAAKEIFNEIQRTNDRQFLLRVGYIEIYNEKIYDLLNKKNQDLKIHETPTGIVSVNCEENIIMSENELLYYLNEGSKERTVGETNMNERSSRSHAIFRIIIESRKIERTDDDAVIQSVINLVDLAGSERADQTGARGTRLKEGGHINKSLLFLSNVIKRLSENEDEFISFRDSKLTRILQASLGGNALTAIICTIKANAIEETQSTLSFALRAKSVKNKPHVNEIISDATMMKRLEKEIKDLKKALEEEQRKNESQIKVRQLENRIKGEVLKIITCNSLNMPRNREKRRRTWCPSSAANGGGSNLALPSALPVPTMIASAAATTSGIAPPPSRMQLPKPSYYHHTPLITLRQPSAEPTTAGSRSSGPAKLPVPPDDLPEIDEEFAPAELVNFDMLSPLQTPKNLQLKTRYLSITPKYGDNPKVTLEKMENELMELQSFTNLENQTGVQHMPDLALKQKVESLSIRNAVLENERLEYILLREEFDIVCSNFKESEQRCDELQAEISKLNNLNKSANDKVSQHEAELAELKKTIEKLEMENREAVNLEFEFKRHQNKSKLRESELLEALSDKDKEIIKLEKSLNCITAEKLQNSKEELLQLSQHETPDEDGKVCVKCEDLQRLLEENKKVTQEFDKLTLEYERLKLNYIELEKENENSNLKIAQFQDIQKADKIESERLKLDIQQLKDKLQAVLKDYEQLSCEHSAKTEACMALDRQVELARDEMLILQTKYDNLEISWQEQQQTLADIQTQYDAIQCKYKSLQEEYKKLETCSEQSLIDCKQLQTDNKTLQTEIETLKLKVEDAQQKLLTVVENEKVYENPEETNVVEDFAENNGAAVQEIENEEVLQQNENIQQQLQAIQSQFEELQKEYDDLSNQLMDNLQESESLKEQNSKLEQQLKNLQEKSSESEINELKSQLERVLNSDRKTLLQALSPCRNNSSMRSSGVCIEEEEFEEMHESDNLLKTFSELSDSVTEIELEHSKGKSKCFKIPIDQNRNSEQKNYKLYLRNIFGIKKTEKEFLNDEIISEEISLVRLQGSFKYHTFHIVELKSCAAESYENGQSITNGGGELKKENSEQQCHEIALLKQEICKLNDLLDEQRTGHKALIENTEKTLSEMREQITHLSAELLEKSIFVENCACKSYQKQIDQLEKEKADMTLVCEELQEKISNCTLEMSQREISQFISGNDQNSIAEADHTLHGELQTLKEKQLELLETIDSQTKMLEDLTQKLLDMESDLQTARDLLATQEKAHKEKCNQMQLEILEKLELSANENQNNLKKYNKEWQDSKEQYEQTIAELERQLQASSGETENGAETFRSSEAMQELQESFDKLKDEHALLLEEQIENENKHIELQKEMESISDIQQAMQEKEALERNLQELLQKYGEKEEQFKLLVNEKDNLLEKLQEMENQTKDLQQLTEEKLKIEQELKQKQILEQEKNEQFEQLQNQLREISSSSDENNSLAKEIALLNDQLNCKTKELQEAKIYLDTVKEDAAQEKNGLSTEILQLSNKFKELEESHENLINVKEEILKEKDSLLTQISQITEQLNQKAKELEDMQQDLANVNDERNSLQMEIDELYAKNKQLEESLQHFSKFREESSDEYNQLNDQLCLKIKELEELQMHLETVKEQAFNEKNALETEITLLSNKIQELQEVQMHLENAKEQASTEKNALETEITQLSNKIQELQASLEHKIIDKKESLDQNDCLELQISQLKDELTLKAKELEELQLELSKVKEESSKEMDSLLTEISQLKEQLTRNVKDLEELQMRLVQVNENALNEKNAFETEITKLKELHKKSCSEKDYLQAEVDQLTMKLSNVKETSTDEKISLETAIKQLNDQLCLKSKELQDIQRNLEEAQKEKTAYHSELQDASNKLEDEKLQFKDKEEVLLKKIDNLSQELHEANVKASNYDKLLQEHEDLEAAANSATKRCENLQFEVTNLKSSSEENIKSQTNRIQELETAIKQLNDQLGLKSKELQDIQRNLEEAQKEKTAYHSELQDASNKLEDEKLQFKDKEEVLLKKIDNLSQELHEANVKGSNYDKLLQEHNDLEAAANSATERCENLQLEVTNLKSSSEENTKSQTNRIQELESDLISAKDKNNTLAARLAQLHSAMQSEKSELQQEYERRKSLELQEKTKNLKLLEEELLKNYEVLKKEKLQLEQQLSKVTEDTTSKINSLETEINQLNDTMSTKCHELQEAHRLVETLQEKKSGYKQEIELLQEKAVNLTTSITDLEMEKCTMLERLNKTRAEFGDLNEKYEKEKRCFKENEETFQQKIEALKQQLHEVTNKANNYDKLMLERNNTETALDQLTKQNESLQNEVTNLLSQHELYSKAQDDRIKDLENELIKSESEKTALKLKVTELETSMKSEENQLQQQCSELRNQLNEMQIKSDSLSSSNRQLHELNEKMQQELLQANENLAQYSLTQDELKSLKIQYSELQAEMETSTAKAKLEKEAIERSCSEEKTKLSNHLTDLQNEKLRLEEKLREITVRNFEQDLQRQTNDVSSNTSMDSNTSFSPRGRRSLERSGDKANVSVEDKIIALHQKNTVIVERKNRRLSVHDERRRQSYWGMTHEKQTMTDPVDSNCNCAELDCKLKECERNLFIRESQVTALNMELKNHPLKDQNAALVKRLQEEQDKYRVEVKRYKQRLSEQTIKTEKALQALAAAKVAAAVKINGDKVNSADSDQAEMAKATVVSVEVQTENELTTTLQILQDKYNDLKNICRHRYTVIKDLEEKVAHKENSDGNSLSAMEAGQIKVLKNQCESLKKELKLIKEKYDNAKLLLGSRREEIRQLRLQLGIEKN